MEGQRQRSRKRKSIEKPGIAVIGGGMIAVALITAFVYIQIGRSYQNVFFPNTVINGMDVSRKSVAEVKKMLALTIDEYTLTLQERGGNTEEIKGIDMGLKGVFDGKLEALLEAQEPLSWGKHVRKSQSFEMNTMIQYDQEKFDTAIASLSALKESRENKPQNAYISDYIVGQGYEIVPAKEGKALDEDKLKDEISNAVFGLKRELSLEEAGVYLSPEIPTTDSSLIHQLQTLNQYVNTTITYDFGNKKEVLGGDIISQWMDVEEDGRIAINRNGVTDFVNEIARTYDTAYKTKSFTTSNGEKIKIAGGNYGWRINKNKEVEELIELISSGTSQVREPVYIQKGASRGDKDYGNTYVEINLTAQHLYFYKDGKLLVESDFVSGNESKGWSTPAGAFPLTYKERNAILKGENYNTPVNYWMPFNGNIGLHDADWRSSFGGTIYKTNGSHGCINLPPSAAKTIFENISAGIPVLCYYLPGTEAAIPSTTEAVTEATTEATTEAATEATTEATTEAETEAVTTEPETTVSAHPDSQNEYGPGV